MKVQYLISLHWLCQVSLTKCCGSDIFCCNLIMEGVSSSNITQPQIPQFNGKNYEYWSIKMKTLFCSQELWDLVENGFTEPPDQVPYNALSQA